MKMRNLFTLALIACLSQPALAHRFWIVPSTTVLSGEKPWITVDAAISNSLFFADHAAPAIEMFTVTGPDGKEVPLQNAMKGKYRTTFDIQLPVSGTYRISTVRASMNASYEENGETKRWRGSAQEFEAAGLKDKPSLQVSKMVSRVETFVTSGEPSLEALAPSGEGLELSVAKTHPNDLFAGEPATFVLLNDGKPAANVEVVLIKGDDRYRSEPGEVKVTTNAEGVFELSFPEAGRYWLNANASSSGQSGSPTARYSYTATFEVLPQ
ncbi:DUF4198 domain-containing protein [Pirellulaceae bacterium SH449]